MHETSQDLFYMNLPFGFAHLTTSEETSLLDLHFLPLVLFKETFFFFWPFYVVYFQPLSLDNLRCL